jgi:ubiquitin-protein ligase E3 D
MSALLLIVAHASLSRIPLSAFIVEDMVELVQAHATYRFVIFDEEDERPRLLVKPLACMTT